MESAPPVRRRLAPTTSLPSTTAEEQAQRHGIPSDISNALQGNLSMRIRQSIGAGRGNSFGRTQSQPVFALNPTGTTGGFATNDQIMREAENIINKDDMRRRELKPYWSGEGSGGSMNALDLASAGGSGGGGRRSPEGGRRRLRFRQDGEVEIEDEGQPGVGGGYRGTQKRAGIREDWGLSSGKKRGAEGDDGEEQDDISDTATEIDEDENEQEPGPQPLLSTSGSTINDEFPPVFASSAAISYPAPAQAQVQGRKGAMLPPRMTGRQMRGLPGRALGKTVSAPVRLGAGMDIDMNQEEAEGDGFDVTEWAAGNTDF